MKRDIEITTADGVARASIFRPEGSEGKVLPGILYYMDALGPRKATDIMGERLAAAALFGGNQPKEEPTSSSNSSMIGSLPRASAVWRTCDAGGAEDPCLSLVLSKAEEQQR